MSVGLWILLWTVIVLLGLVFHAAVLFKVGLKGKRVLDTASQVADELSTGMKKPSEAQPSSRVSGMAALFVDPAQAREAYRIEREERREARIRRRIDNKRLRSQPQRYGDLYRP
ncbi:hypothetical protein [Zhihengliuella flava]|uniref:Type II secretory pathway component HofQ n=1 Tax=Zhihengliuella flava TaxID=1285193 RepID=A0A931D6Q2_9MICC|nr:hypothetical protein [Zhihengliuella flava]MBG6083392.1 type II secretory pathway component HofQ [Zhihengliuella flava]